MGKGYIQGKESYVTSVSEQRIDTMLETLGHFRIWAMDIYKVRKVTSLPYLRERTLPQFRIRAKNIYKVKIIMSLPYLGQGYIQGKEH